MIQQNPRTTEDKLLYEYWRQVRGRIYTEVPIAGRKGDAAWSSHSTTRRLDGVRVPAQQDKEGIVPFAGLRQEFCRWIQDHSPELIEVKLNINRTAIGQVIAGSDLFERQYNVQPGKLVIVCVVGDSALEWVCAKRNIFVVKLRNDDLTIRSSRSRPRSGSG